MRRIVSIVLIVIFTAACVSSAPNPAEQTSIVATKAQEIFDSILATGAATVPTDTPIAATQIPFTGTPSSEPSATENILQIPSIDAANCVPKNTQRDLAQVVRVVDVDTIEVEIKGQNYRVRYIGMDTPEGGAPFSTEATQANLRLLENQQVLLVKDVSDVDVFGRLLRYVFAGSQFVNYELVKQGYAQALTYPPDVACDRTFGTAQQSALTAGFGLWGMIANQPTSTEGGQGNCDPSYPDVCIPPPPPDLDCGDISFRRFTVLPPDPHRFDGDHNGIGCESG